jgi:hypothetical protein
VSCCPPIVDAERLTKRAAGFSPRGASWGDDVRQGGSSLKRWGMRSPLVVIRRVPLVACPPVRLDRCHVMTLLGGTTRLPRMPAIRNLDAPSGSLPYARAPFSRFPDHPPRYTTVRATRPRRAVCASDSAPRGLRQPRGCPPRAATANAAGRKMALE